MKNKLYRFNITRTLFKNKEIYLKVTYNLHRCKKLFISQTLFKNKMHKITVKGLKDNLKSLKGYSMINKKRKAFYSKFQLIRFDIKKLCSKRSLIGLRSFFW